MEDLVQQIIVILTGLGAGFLGSTFLTWLKKIGVKEEDAKNLINSLASVLNIVITILVTYGISLILSQFDENLSLGQFLSMSGVSLLTSNKIYLERKKLGLKV